MAVYSPHIVYFDVVPPLRYVGAATMRARFVRWFSLWESPIGQHVTELAITASEELTCAHMLIRASGVLAGREVEYWLRTTDVCRRAAAGWLIAHEHVSLPVDLGTGTAAMDLLP